MPADAQSLELSYTHFALIYIDADGIICLRVSDSIAKSWQEILSTQVTDAFLRAVGMAIKTCSSNYQVEQGMPVSPNQAPAVIAKTTHSSHMTQEHYVGTRFGVEARMRKPVPVATCFRPLVRPICRQSWPCLSTEDPSRHRKELCKKDFNMISDKKAMVSVKDRDILALYYMKAFEDLQQTNCRILAKAYIKLVEPQKQVNYPYNGRKIVAMAPRQFDPEMTKPPWWPSGVSHREPDHLPKVERIQLLVHILRELRTSHGISVAKLQGADQPIRHLISPPERLHILDELYQVRHQEEKSLEGSTGKRKEKSLGRLQTDISSIDGQTIACISLVNRPKPAETNASCADGSGNSTISNPVTIQDSEPFVSCSRYASTLTAPDRQFSTSSSSSARPSQITGVKPERQFLEHQRRFDTMCVPPPVLKRKRGSFETYPVHTRSPSISQCMALLTTFSIRKPF
ncbi:hypothetical protein N7522_011610 [Penicillium canescens]|uniref:Subtelomeric hrmA-associated cluster protein AFUB-079030/YDR124W-like helical bundle domain-containing protein n=1 Tax=Penicillium canescens TaxID=5083 RepID=A0AAD6IMR7_PENCN|nr:uncharacterized protein N7446_007328 [Penicillium canescens]KAJ5991403.1 hypothetical protein N7522_011610 [Penicillium canescens]KAJ6052685.1 hypothetical protein N7460_003219 [Penicillium canescens]KAJ6063208.1 hypothetical protein N7446_007328 [Penicillium canescens]KAJ6181742.1 hypothetical protein N7485_000384 [Penicillium canescens]